jgi:hypothetical protein
MEEPIGAALQQAAIFGSGAVTKQTLDFEVHKTDTQTVRRP